MDPDANLERLLELARALADLDPVESSEETEQAIELAHTVIALHDWLAKGGFLPKDWDLGRNQGTALLRLIKERGTPRYAHVNDPNEWMMAGYVLVTFPDGFDCGIAPDGSVSS